MAVISRCLAFVAILLLPVGPARGLDFYGPTGEQIPVEQYSDTTTHFLVLGVFCGGVGSTSLPAPTKAGSDPVHTRPYLGYKGNHKSGVSWSANVFGEIGFAEYQHFVGIDDDTTLLDEDDYISTTSLGYEIRSSIPFAEIKTKRSSVNQEKIVVSQDSYQYQYVSFSATVPRRHYVSITFGHEGHIGNLMYDRVFYSPGIVFGVSYKNESFTRLKYEHAGALRYKRLFKENMVTIGLKVHPGYPRAGLFIDAFAHDSPVLVSVRLEVGHMWDIGGIGSILDHREYSSQYALLSFGFAFTPVLSPGKKAPFG